jgi:hypothetical protein
MSESNAEFWEKIRPMREWAETPLGKLFARFEALTGNAWVADQNPNSSDRRLTEIWDKQRAARNEFLRAIGAPVDGPPEEPPTQTMALGKGWRCDGAGGWSIQRRLRI